MTFHFDHIHFSVLDHSKPDMLLLIPVCYNLKHQKLSKYVLFDQILQKKKHKIRNKQCDCLKSLCSKGIIWIFIRVNLPGLHHKMEKNRSQISFNKHTRNCSLSFFCFHFQFSGTTFLPPLGKVHVITCGITLGMSEERPIPTLPNPGSYILCQFNAFLDSANT